MMRTWSRFDLWLCAALVWGATFCAAFSVIALLRLPLGLAVGLFVPGYLLQAILYPQTTALSAFVRIGYSIGFSLAIVVLLGLGLNLTVGLQTTALLLAITAFCMLAIWLAWWRRATLPKVQYLTAADPPNAKNSRLFLTIMLLCISELALLGLFLVVINPANQNLTELYLLDANRQTVSFPTSVKVSEPVTVQLGITNGDGQPNDYRVEILINGQPGGNAGAWRIASNGKLEVKLTFTPLVPGSQVPVLFRLYRAGDNTPHRTVRLIIPSVI